MHLPRHTIESHQAAPLFTHASFCSAPPSGETSSGSGNHHLAQPAVFSCATLSGFFVAQSDPLKLVATRSWSASQGGLSCAVPIHHTSLLALVGGGRVPRFAPNKVILWDETAEAESSRTRFDTLGAGPTRRGSESSGDGIASSSNSAHASTIFSAGSKFNSFQDLNDSLHSSTADHESHRQSVHEGLEADDWDTASLLQPGGRAPIRALGAQVAELEFSEIVRGVYVTSCPAASTSTKGKAAEYRTRADELSHILLVLLSTKAVVFELSKQPQHASSGSATAPWAITKRSAVSTYKNHKGIGAIACLTGRTTSRTNSGGTAIVAVPGRQKGHVQILRIKSRSLSAKSEPHNYPLHAPPSPEPGAAAIIVAHESSVASIVLSPDGHLLATASSKGTLLRIWSNNNPSSTSSSASGFSAHGAKVLKHGRTGFGATLVRELRRGSDPTAILSMAFAPDSSAIAAASDKGTIHVFQLLDLVSGPMSRTTSSDGPSTPDSRAPAATKSFGSTAAKYLPTGLSAIAGQIPPSMLPQYFKSEWSSARFRIPLKTFGATSRMYRYASGDRGPGNAAEAGSARQPGTEKSTDGAWAHMRSRISDIRKGEAGVDEGIFLSWITEPGSEYRPEQLPYAQEKRDSSRRASMGKQKALDTSPLDTHDQHAQSRFRLLALTTSGGWYKLALEPKVDPTQVAEMTGSTVLDMYRSESSHATPPPTSSLKEDDSRVNRTPYECRLVEYRPILTSIDDWRI
ncbi:hypothetical protein BCV70DRAFT_198055 [Testicularia cyperi]|uniref:WD40 repeat-like protein n=1 Tax=Testicularia cyperi TaxID=1882483 RepID=A0A317Y003_9BASI|nr:hypothetical protein BCV70DRAFT_198055 [Testicularia cyperi]